MNRAPPPALDCCDCEAIGWVANSTGCTGDDVRDLMLECVEKHFGDQLPATSVQWISDNDPAYIVEKIAVLLYRSDYSLCNPSAKPEARSMAACRRAS